MFVETTTAGMDLADRSATCFVMLGCVERLDEAALMHDMIYLLPTGVIAGLPPTCLSFAKTANHCL